MQLPTPPDSSTPPTPEIIKITSPAKRARVPRWLEWLVAGFIGLALLGMVLPVFNSVNVRGCQTKSLSNAKQIALALKLFATDHDGNYPRQGIPTEMTTAPKDSNTAFACLFPTYITSEKIFRNPQSAYQTAVPDDVIDVPYTGVPRETLQPGENVYSYVMGLTDNDPPTTPLVADGTDGHGHYCADPGKRGGVWKGKSAVVIRLDNTGELTPLSGLPNARFIPRDREHPAGNLFDFTNAGKTLTLLDPATGPRRK